jgi:probable HAF family extracellular repeat protein
MRTRIVFATVVACIAALPLSAQKPKGQPSFATLVKLPSLGSNAEAHGVNAAGTVIVGHSFDRAGFLYAVKWTVQNGAWVISTLPYPGSALARGIDDLGNVVGYGATPPRRPLYWPAAGGHTVLGCEGEAGETQAISANGGVVVGHLVGGGAAAWNGTAPCTENLPPLEPAGTAAALAVNGDGSIIGGRATQASGAAGVPVRWVLVEGVRQIEQIDSRPGIVRGANANGDLAGQVTVPCTQGSCVRAVVWYAPGGSYDLGTLGGNESWARDINASGEVVGLSTSATGTNTGFFWSLSTGMLQLPANRWAAANAMSDVRSDGSRLVVGMDSQANAVVWVVRVP